MKIKLLAEEKFPSGAPLDVLKIVAATAMVIDHINYIVLTQHPLILWQIGRCAFPLFCFTIACNLLRDADAVSYVKRILLLAVPVQPIYTIAFHGREGNIFFTLATAIVTAAALSQQRLVIQHIVLAAGVIIIYEGQNWTNWGIAFGLSGTLLPAAIMGAMGNNRTIAVWAILLVVELNIYRPMDLFDREMLQTASIIFAGCGASLLFAWFFTGRARFLPRYALHAFYPGHLIVLVFLKAVLR